MTYVMTMADFLNLYVPRELRDNARKELSKIENSAYMSGYREANTDAERLAHNA